MVVPRFRIVQTDNHLIVIVRVPYVKISNAEVYVEKNKFTFYLKPYLLNLHFNNELREEDPESAVYDHNTYEVTFKLRKKNKGEYFEDTDMINALLSKKKKEEKKTVKIEVLGGQDFSKEESKEEDSDKTEKIEKPIINKKPQEVYSYGFNRSFEKFFTNLEEELLELCEVDPDKSNLLERRELKMIIEEEKFDYDHYLADKFENPEIDRLISQKLPMLGSQQANEDVNYSDNAMGKFTEEEWNLVNKLTKKEFLIDNTRVLLMQLIDILYAFLYEYRTMEGDFTSESGWTINKLSSTLSCFIEETDLRQVLISSLRRSLIYPLFRSTDLSFKVLDDLVQYLRAGKLPIMKAFLKIKYILERSEPRYLFNTLYIDDFCVYLQNIDKKVFEEIATQIEGFHLEKKDLGLNLEEIEKEALEVVEEAENEKDLPKPLEHETENKEEIDDTENEFDKLE